jgi:hypothetical protein
LPSVRLKQAPARHGSDDAQLPAGPLGAPQPQPHAVQRIGGSAPIFLAPAGELASPIAAKIAMVKTNL